MALVVGVEQIVPREVTRVLMVNVDRLTILTKEW